MNNNPTIQILKFFGLHPYWINNKTTNINSKFKLHLYSSCFCFIYFINLIYSIIEAFLYPVNNKTIIETNIDHELQAIYSIFVNLYTLISCISCTLRYQVYEKILLNINKFDNMTKNRKKQKFYKIIIEWFVIITIIVGNILGMLYNKYVWHQFIKYFIISSLIYLDKVKFIIFVSEINNRFILLNEMFITSKLKISIKIVFFLFLKF